MVVIFRVSRGKIRVKTSYEHKERCKAVDGARWNPDDYTWDYPADHWTANALRDAFRGAGRAVADSAFRDLLLAADQGVPEQARRAANLPFGDDLDPRAVDPSTLPDIPTALTQPWGHQKRGFWFVVKMFGGLPE